MPDLHKKQVLPFCVIPIFIKEPGSRNRGEGDPGNGLGEPEGPGEPDGGNRPEGPDDGTDPKVGGAGIRKWIPSAAAGAAVTGAGGGAWYFFIFWKRRKFHGIFAEEGIPGTREWGVCDPGYRERWFIPELAARLGIGEITWEDYFLSYLDTSLQESVRECESDGDRWTGDCGDGDEYIGGGGVL